MEPIKRIFSMVMLMMEVNGGLKYSFKRKAIKKNGYCLKAIAIFEIKYNTINEHSLLIIPEIFL